MKEPSPEVKAIISGYVAEQRAKYGEDWKRIKAEEMTAQMAPQINRFVDAMNALREQAAKK